MNTQDFSIISSVALATATLTVAVFLPNSLDAGNDSAPQQITQPKLVSHGVEFTLAAPNNRTFKTGDEPAFDLNAVNTSGEDAAVDVQISMTSMAPSSRFSRMPAFPQTLWQKSCSVTLKPHETKVISIATATKLPANRTIDVMLQPVNPQDANAVEKPATQTFTKAGGPSAIVAMSFSTISPAQGTNPTLN